VTDLTAAAADGIAAAALQPGFGNTAVGSDFELMLAEIRAHDRFLLTAHEGPDGDALGSLLGMHRLLTKLGKDSVMFLAAKEFPLPIEYRFLPLEEVFHEAPADMADRVIMFLDCGNIDRMPVPFLTEGGNRRLNIDHHHDNTRFGDANLVAPKASCTAEIVYDIAHVLGVPIDADMAMPLYVGLITDTGKFMYENTNAHTHRVAAELIDAGVDVDDTYRRLYEHVPIEKLRLVARALDGIGRHCDNRLVISYINTEDYAATGAGEEMTEGVIDHLRSIDGVKVAAVVRDLGNRGRSARKVSLRSSEGDVDVSAIARKQGGGGHKRAAGFSTDDDLTTLVDFLCGEVTSQLGL
jgi:bifunctional oligoribonuclease and PAP phosphatase NrnA